MFCMCWEAHSWGNMPLYLKTSTFWIRFDSIRFDYSKSARPYESCKIFKGWPHTSFKLAQLWYKSFPPDQRGQAEMKKPTRLSNKTSTAWSCAEDQILEN